MFKMQQHLNM